ncbi:hypothetical protein Pmar_PMAR015987 [Perkinsus marinus ATCC 50983]|uniref:Uncharacterized protein n=1 Tax=Perkinsus marinus (strain ATCC 50983 / TXsc) TaxID=423536 RepID=C5LTL6_PERM5|nr:hypothetical protein Pmar_PMAR015987 [Perkinsus marinus ATCC 50983]EEQ99927.1 hypothetical protein Pmar_PMAR015987 [Perkinsus marinus ATCC 50983]|eukprot:XP_002767210.1 hypothetical protein Pmar_PMAR015987 [Perkinsus marinus ATCC 50983]
MEPMVIGQVPLSKPRKLQWDNGEPLFSLLKEDIAGTSSQRYVGSIPFNIYGEPLKGRPDFHSTNDIPGAQVNSLVKGIVTRRKLDPQNPKYTFLDGSKGLIPKNLMCARPITEVVSEAERGLPPRLPSSIGMEFSTTSKVPATTVKGPPEHQHEVPSARHSIVTVSTPGMTAAQRLDQFITPGPTARSSPPPV